LNLIEKSLKTSLDTGGSFEIIVGLDFKTTDPKAIKFLIDLKKDYPLVSFYCYGDKKKNKTDIVFHPKIHLFENKKETTAIVGSTNLTGGGLTTNFEVNTVFQEKKPEYFSQIQAIYNSIKFTDSLFVPDEEYLSAYSDVFKVLEKNSDSVNQNKKIQETIKFIEEKEGFLPGTIPSIKSMVIDLILEREKNIGNSTVTLDEIYLYLEDRIKRENLEGKYKLETFRNTVRGELNHNEISNQNSSKNLQLFERVDRGIYKLTKNGKNFKGR
jgi:HKD family nuclease